MTIDLVLYESSNENCIAIASFPMTCKKHEVSENSMMTSNGHIIACVFMLWTSTIKVNNSLCSSNLI